MITSFLLATGLLLGNLGSENTIVCICNSDYQAGTEVRGITWQVPVQRAATAPISKRDLVRKIVGYAGKVPVLGSAIQFVQRIENMARGENFKMEANIDPFKEKYGLEFTFNFPVAK